MTPRIILASTSKIRQHLLDQAGVTYQSIAPNFDENHFKHQHEGTPPLEMVASLAYGKALSLSHLHPDTIIIGADQLLELGGQTLSKPTDMAEAQQQLERLKGKAHVLHSSISCVRNGKPTWSTTQSATLTMRNFSPAFLASYLSEGGTDLLTSVGAYKLEERGIQLFQNINGDYHTILGFPLLPLLSYLRTEGVIAT